MAARSFNKKGALESEVKDLWLKFTQAEQDAATLTLDTTEPIIVTSVATGAIANGGTLTIQVLAAAANDDDEVLVAVTGTAAAITVTITPNDGTNNTATPVTLTTEEVAELLDSGDVVGKTIVLTDASSLLDVIDNATGGDATDIANNGEADGESGTFAGGADNITLDSAHGILSVERTDEGEYEIVLEDNYASLKYVRAILSSTTAADVRFQLKSEQVSNSSEPKIVIIPLTAGSAVDVPDDASVLVKLEVKNVSRF
jgi:hypothetical protein